MEKNIDIELIKDDLDIKASLSALNDSKGGKILIKSLLGDIISSINNLADNYSTLTVQEFISIGSKLRTSIDIIQVLSKSESDKKYYEVLLEEELKKAE